MYIGSILEDNIQIIDDVTRIMDVKNYWKSKSITSYQSYLVNSVSPRKRDNENVKSRIEVGDILNEQNQHVKFPKVNRRKNAIERNKEYIKKISLKKKKNENNQSNVEYSKPPLPQNILLPQQEVEEDQFPLPSTSYTKQENLMILDQLTTNFNLFKKKIKQRSLSELVPQETQEEEDETFLTYQKQDKKNQQEYIKIKQESQRQATQQEEGQQIQTKQENKKIYRQIMNADGTNFPYKLYMMNKSRKRMIELMTNDKERNKSFEVNGENQTEYFDNIKKKDEQGLENQLKFQEDNKKKIELVSRGSLNNAYYGLRALPKKSQKQVQNSLKQHQPEDSRFYNI